MEKRLLFQYILGALIVLGFFVLLGLLITKSVPETNNDLLNLAIGALIGNFGAIVSYYYGSSVGSAKKDDTINDMLKNDNN